MVNLIAALSTNNKPSDNSPMLLQFFEMIQKSQSESQRMLTDMISKSNENTNRLIEKISDNMDKSLNDLKDNKDKMSTMDLITLMDSKKNEGVEQFMQLSELIESKNSNNSEPTENKDSMVETIVKTMMPVIGQQMMGGQHQRQVNPNVQRRRSLGQPTKQRPQNNRAANGQAQNGQAVRQETWPDKAVEQSRGRIISKGNELDLEENEMGILEPKQSLIVPEVVPEIVEDNKIVDITENPDRLEMTQQEKEQIYSTLLPILMQGLDSALDSEEIADKVVEVSIQNEIPLDRLSICIELSELLGMAEAVGIESEQVENFYAAIVIKIKNKEDDAKSKIETTSKSEQHSKVYEAANESGGEW